MKAWRVHHGFESLALRQISAPAPGPGEVLIEVRAAALNFSDLLMIRGAYQIKPPPPFTPGQEIAGVVLQPDANSAYGAGTKVATKVPWGGFAERAVAREDMLIRLPEDMPFCAAATLPVVWPTAWIALRERARMSAGEVVLVHAAAGGVGLASVQLAKAAGTKVLACVGDIAKQAVCREAGADEVFSYHDGDWVRRVRDATAGRGADVIVDPVGGDITDASLKCLAYGGRLLIVGFASGRIAEIKANRLLLRNASAMGVYWSHDSDGPLVARAMDELLQLHAAGQVRIAAHAEYAFEDLPRALAALEERRTIGKSVLRADSQGNTP